VNRDGFEARVLDLWVTTRVPLTRTNLQYATGATRKQVERWLDGMLGEGVVDIGSDEDGELMYTVRGAVRSTTGPTSIAEVAKLKSLESQVKGNLVRAGKALALAPQARALVSGHSASAGDGSKSIVASAALSFFLGPVGWLYAAPLREALPAILVFAVLYKILPMVLFAPLLGILLPISAIAGAGYAWAHNQSGGRASLGKAARKLGRGSKD
jgi:hypothetical protein